MMRYDTLCVLEGFLREAALDKLSAEITPLEVVAHRVDYRCIPYGLMNNAENGRDFEYAPLIRDETDENNETFCRILDGSDWP